MLNTQQFKEIYSNEQIVLVLISRLYFGTCDKPAVAGFIAEHTIDWALVLRLTKVHGIRAFIYSVIADHGLETPQRFQLNLKKRYYEIKLKNLNQIKAATVLAAALEKQNIILIPYKGVSFATAYYKDWASRESQDMDFLVAAENVETIEQYFISQGFAAKTTVPEPYLGYYKMFFKDIVYHHPEADASVEIHWRLMERFTGNFPAYRFFSEGIVPYRTGSFATNRLSPTYDFLAVASNHFVKDMSIKFKYLIDMACLIRKEQEALDEQLIFSCAEKYAFKKRLSAGLELVNQILGIQFKNAGLHTLDVDLLKTTLAHEIYLNRLYINEAKFIRRSLMLQDNRVQQLKFLLRCLQYAFLPTYADINEMKLPVYLLPLLMLLRPVRLIYLAIKPKS